MGAESGPETAIYLLQRPKLVTTGEGMIGTTIATIFNRIQ